MDERVPQYHGIEMLATYAEIIDGTLDSTLEQYETLVEAKDKPHALNRDMVERMVVLYNNHIDDNWVLIEQLKRWAVLDLKASQRQEVERLQDRVMRIEPEAQKVLELLEEHFVGQSIEDVLEMDDAELGLAFLLGKHKF